MRLVKIGNRIINLGLVAWAEQKKDDALDLHFCVPVATSMHGSTVRDAAEVPAASDHYVMRLKGAEATEALNALMADVR